MKILKIFMLLALLASAGVLSGCFALPVEEEFEAPAFFALRDPPIWRTVTVQRGRVELFSTLVARHEPARQELVRFPEGNVLITGVYVDVGDEVAEGDIIASLARTGIATELANLQREEERMILRIEQLQERHDHTLWTAEVTGTPVDDSFYVNLMADLAEDLYMLRQELDYVNRRHEERLVRATMDGVVTFAIDFTERTNSTFNQHVATISDHTVSFFVVNAREAEALPYGSRFIMNITGLELWVELVDPVEHGIERPEVGWVERIFMTDCGTNFTQGVIGHIHAVTDAVDDALFLPSVVIHRHEGRTFVFTVEDGIRRIRDIETGLVGNALTVVLNGLEEGDVVVR